MGSDERDRHLAVFCGLIVCAQSSVSESDSNPTHALSQGLEEGITSQSIK